MWSGGVDEAGYGPSLGPLVVSLIALRACEERATDGWRLLGDAVRRGGKRGHGALVDDSKIVYRPGRGFAGLVPLETTVLAWLHAAGSEPCDFDAYLEAVAPGALAHVKCYPWYFDHALKLPAAAPLEAVKTAAGRIRKRLRERRVETDWRVAPLLEGDFNRLCRESDSKGAALFETFGGLLARFRERTVGEDALLVVDRHGGRAFYAPLLQRACPDAFVVVDREEGGRSDYRLLSGGARLSVSFRERADGSAFEVALASMFSKYTRELFMVLFNRYWCAFDPGLRPTAGYSEDARRFLKDIEPEVERLRIDRSLLVRCR